MRTLAVLFLLLFPTSSFAENLCEPKIDAFLNGYQVYRVQIFHEKISKCIPDNKSFIQISDNPDSRIDIIGFVVGIESFWSQTFGSIIKVTSKAGGHTTIVKLLARKSGFNNFNPDLNENFTSSMEYIVVSKEGPNYLTVKVRNNHMSNNCQWVTEDVHVLSDKGFSINSSDEIIRKCT